MRYYFPDQAGLLSFAMDLVSRRVSERVSAVKAEGSPTEIALQYLEEVIPLDDERRSEFEVWLSFVAQAGAESGATGLRDHLDPVQDSLRELCTSLLNSLADSGALRADLALDLEAERLHALLDGLSLHASIQPGHTTATRVREILGRHLAGLLS
ncbi:MAG: hypothetical protein QOG10_3996 [Kribbellaceae bacterium]|nr:hypothetical protein [Kribbellaceae bacterium]